ncbi:MAG: hypothetical protein ACREIQ_13035, partial [Nitrospiria bacterium]
FTQPTLSEPNTKLIEYLEKLGVNPGLPQKDLVIKGVKVPLKEDEWRTLAKSNTEAMDYIQRNYLTDSNFKRLPMIRQKRYVEAVFDRFRDKLKNQMMSRTSLGTRARQEVRSAYQGG